MTKKRGLAYASKATRSRVASMGGKASAEARRCGKVRRERLRQIGKRTVKRAIPPLGIVMDIADTYGDVKTIRQNRYIKRRRHMRY